MNRRCTGAQSLVEFALIAPVLILIAMAVWDGGGALRDQVILDQAARDGARVGATAYAGSGAPSASEICGAVATSAADLAGLTCGSSNVTYPPGAVQVQLRYAHALWTPVLRQLWGGGQGDLMLRASATFFVPSLTPVPASVVPSTLTPTPSPTRTPVPTATLTRTPTATATPPPTATATPAAQFTCDNSLFAPHVVVVPQLPAASGYWVSFSVPLNDWIVVTWYVPDTSGLRVALYQGSPPGVTPVSVGQGNLDNAIVASSAGPTTSAGVYSVYLYNPTNSAFRSSSLASIGCT